MYSIGFILHSENYGVLPRLPLSNQVTGNWERVLSGRCPQAKVYLTWIMPPSQGLPTYTDWSGRRIKTQFLCFEEEPSQRFPDWQLNPCEALKFNPSSVHTYFFDLLKGVGPKYTAIDSPAVWSYLVVDCSWHSYALFYLILLFNLTMRGSYMSFPNYIGQTDARESEVCCWICTSISIDVRIGVSSFCLLLYYAVIKAFRTQHVHVYWRLLIHP